MWKGRENVEIRNGTEDDLCTSEDEIRFNVWKRGETWGEFDNKITREGEMVV